MTLPYNPLFLDEQPTQTQTNQMAPTVASALIGGLRTGLSPSQQVDISKYYNEQPQQREDNTLLYIAIIAAVLIAGGTIYFVTR